MTEDEQAGQRWWAHMLAGDFERAWQQSDALRARNAPDPHRFWSGRSLAGKRVIVRCLHGFGDAVQMLCYAPQLQRLASRVIFEVPPRLLPIAHFFEGVEDVITWGDLAPAKPPVWDEQVEIMELPYLFRTTLSNLPVAKHYLRIPSLTLREASERMGARTRPRIGIVLSSGDWNPARNLPPALLTPILAEGRFEFWSLEHSVDVTAPMRPQVNVTGEGILALAASIANLDLVLTVDTLAAHLAGAQGIPVWLLLQHDADWRWLNGRTDSPWYPAMRIFRQPAPADWAGAVELIRQELGSLVS